MRAGPAVRQPQYCTAVQRAHCRCVCARRDGRLRQREPGVPCTPLRLMRGGVIRCPVGGRAGSTPVATPVANPVANSVANPVVHTVHAWKHAVAHLVD